MGVGFCMLGFYEKYLFFLIKFCGYGFKKYAFEKHELQ